MWSQVNCIRGRRGHSARHIYGCGDLSVNKNRIYCTTDRRAKDTTQQTTVPVATSDGRADIGVNNSTKATCSLIGVECNRRTLPAVSEIQVHTTENDCLHVFLFLSIKRHAADLGSVLLSAHKRQLLAAQKACHTNQTDTPTELQPRRTLIPDLQ